MKILTPLILAAHLVGFATGGAVAQSARWNALSQPPTYRAAEQRVEAQTTNPRRDPTGILRGQGVSSLYGGMGNMGGGSGRSANTGIGLGGLGASQGARN